MKNISNREDLFDQMEVDISDMRFLDRSRSNEQEVRGIGIVC